MEIDKKENYKFNLYNPDNNKTEFVEFDGQKVHDIIMAYIRTITHNYAGGFSAFRDGGAIVNKENFDKILKFDLLPPCDAVRNKLNKAEEIFSEIKSAMAKIKF